MPYIRPSLRIPPNERKRLKMIRMYHEAHELYGQGNTDAWDKFISTHEFKNGTKITDILSAEHFSMAYTFYGHLNVQMNKYQKNKIG